MLEFLTSKNLGEVAASSSCLLVLLQGRRESDWNHCCAVPDLCGIRGQWKYFVHGRRKYCPLREGRQCSSGTGVHKIRGGHQSSSWGCPCWRWRRRWCMPQAPATSLYPTPPAPTGLHPAQTGFRPAPTGLHLALTSFRPASTGFRSARPASTGLHPAPPAATGYSRPCAARFQPSVFAPGPDYAPARVRV